MLDEDPFDIDRSYREILYVYYQRGVRKSIRGLSKPFDSVDHFLDENRHLFTIIGVFSAVSVYFISVQDRLSKQAANAADLAFVAGFGIVLIVLSLIFYKLLKKIHYGKGPLANILLMLLAGVLVWIPLSVVLILRDFPTALAAFYAVAVLAGSLLPTFLWASGLISISEVLSRVLDREAKIIAQILILISGALITSLITLYPRLVEGSYIYDIGVGAKPMTWLFGYLEISFVLLFFGILFTSAIVVVGYSITGLFLLTSNARNAITQSRYWP